MPFGHLNPRSFHPGGGSTSDDPVLEYLFGVNDSLATGGTVGAELTFARTGVARDYNSSGVLTSFATGVPGFGYDPADLHSLGVFIEGARTNICLQSQDFETTWANAGSNTAFSKDNLAPDGTTTATDVAHGDTAEDVIQAITVADNTVHCFSMFVHDGDTGTHDWIQVEYRDASDNDNGFEFWFNVVTGALGTARASGTGGFTAAGVQDVGGGWYRIWASGQIVSGQTDAEIVIMNVTANEGTTADTNSLWWWQAQLEVGAFPSSPIYTTTIAVARNAETLKTTDMGWVNNAALTYVTTVSLTHSNTGNAFVFELSDNTGNNR